MATPLEVRQKTIQEILQIQEAITNSRSRYSFVVQSCNNEAGTSKRRRTEETVASDEIEDLDAVVDFLDDSTTKSSQSKRNVPISAIMKLSQM